MKLLPTIKDSTQRESHTLLFVALAVLPLILKFAAAGLNLPLVGAMPAMAPSEFAAAFAMVMAVWLGREWIKK